MTGQTRHGLVALTLAHDDLAARGEPDGEPALRGGAVWRVNRGPQGGHKVARAWKDLAGGEHRWKAHAPVQGSGYAQPAAGEAFVVRTALLAPAGLRAWVGLEPLHDQPAGTVIAWRLWDGASEWSWNGSAWAVAGADADASEWTSTDDLQINLASYPQRGLGLVARMDPSGDGSQAPAFFGARVVMELRDQGDEHDALILTLQRSLRSSLRSTVWQRTRYAGGPVELTPDWPTLARGVAVCNETTDPHFATPLAGVLEAGSQGSPGTPASWTPAAAPALGDVLRLEIEAEPDVVVKRSREIAQLPRLPAVQIYPAGGAETLEAIDVGPVRHRLADGLALDPSGQAKHSQDLDVVLVAQTPGDARRLQSAVGDQLGKRRYRAFVSPETGRIVTVREVAPFSSGGGSLAGDVTQIRATWKIEYEARHVRIFPEVHLLQAYNLSSSEA